MTDTLLAERFKNFALLLEGNTSVSPQEFEAGLNAFGPYVYLRLPVIVPRKSFELKEGDNAVLALFSDLSICVMQLDDKQRSAIYDIRDIRPAKWTSYMADAFLTVGLPELGQAILDTDIDLKHRRFDDAIKLFLPEVNRVMDLYPAEDVIPALAGTFIDFLRKRSSYFDSQPPDKTQPFKIIIGDAMRRFRNTILCSIPLATLKPWEDDGLAPQDIGFAFMFFDESIGIINLPKKLGNFQGLKIWSPEIQAHEHEAQELAALRLERKNLLVGAAHKAFIAAGGAELVETITGFDQTMKDASIKLLTDNIKTVFLKAHPAPPGAE